MSKIFQTLSIVICVLALNLQNTHAVNTFSYQTCAKIAHHSPVCMECCGFVFGLVRGGYSGGGVPSDEKLSHLVTWRCGEKCLTAFGKAQAQKYKR